MLVWLRTLGWLACVIYATIPFFWMMIHSRPKFWKERASSPYRALLPLWAGTGLALALVTAPWRNLALYNEDWAWIPALAFFAVGIWIYRRSGAEFSWVQLGGLPELDPGHSMQKLITTGIRSRLRHPIYLAHLCEMFAWSIGTGLVVCWGLTSLAIGTGIVMIRMEDAELEARFGNEYRQYQAKVPAVFPWRSKRTVASEQISNREDRQAATQSQGTHEEFPESKMPL